MCGRTVCTLSQEHIQKACSVLNPKTGQYEPLKYRDVSNGGKSYEPSHNICPTDVTPVIVSDSDGERCLRPMMWGMIPPWHKGSYKSHGLSTNNCRFENMEKSKLYNEPFQRGHRCIVLCEGFYEWQTTKGKNKQPYFIYSPQEDGVKINDRKTWTMKLCSKNGWLGPRLLFMAALYNPWTSPEGDEFLCYSIITMESTEILSWLHHRMPGILKTEEEINTWLKAGKLLDYPHPSAGPTKFLKWHPVSSDVNNSRNKSVGLNKSFVPAKSKSAGLMMSWLQGGKKEKRMLDEDETPKAKLQKLEETNE